MQFQAGKMHKKNFLTGALLVLSKARSWITGSILIREGWRWVKYSGREGAGRG